MIRLIWLAFALIVVLFVFVPKILHAETPELTVAWCDKYGLCYIKEDVLDAIIKLAEKAGKNCI